MADGNNDVGMECESLTLECPNCSTIDPLQKERKVGDEITCSACHAVYALVETSTLYTTSILRTPLPRRLWKCEHCLGFREALGYRTWKCKQCGDILDDNKTCIHCGGPGPFDYIRIGDRLNDVIALCPNIDCRRRVRMHHIGQIRPGGR